jgi:uncharacterized coiled-coil DUF342 family protein
MEFEELKSKRDELNSKVKQLREERRQVIEQMKALKPVIREEKEQRNKANEEVKSLKEKRVAAFVEINKIKKELDEIVKLVGNFNESVGGSYRLLKEDLKQLEWDYQTGVYSIKKEKELVKEMDNLEKEIARSEILHDKKIKLSSSQKKLRELYLEANIYHNLLINRAKESEKHHDAMMKKIREIEALDKKIIELDKETENTGEEADRWHDELSKIKPPARRPEISDEIKKRAEEILENFKSGKKVTMEELALLEELGLY